MMSNRRYNMFHIPFMSFFSGRLYADVALRWKGACLIFLFLLLAGCWGAQAVRAHVQFGKLLEDEELLAIIEKVPNVQLSGGELSADVEQPYFISDPDSGQAIIILDTTGEVTELPDDQTVVLITRTKLIARQSPHQVREYDLSEFEVDFALDQEKIMGWIELAGKWVGPVFFGVMFSFGLLYRLCWALILALVGMGLRSTVGTHLRFGALFRLAVVAMTPVILVKTLLALTDIRMPGMSGLVYTGVAILLLFYGLKSAASAEHDDVYGDDEDEIDENGYGVYGDPRHTV